MRGVRGGGGLTLVETLVRQLHGVDAEAPLVRARLVEGPHPVVGRVLEVVHVEQGRVAVTDPRNLQWNGEEIARW